MKCLHLIRYSTLPNRRPPHSLNHNKKLSLICILKAKSEAKGITRNLIPTIGDITDLMVRGPLQ